MTAPFAPDHCWPFVCAVYARPGLAELCLALQERYDADVPLLLFIGWLAAVHGIAADEADIAAAQAEIGTWRARVIKPLRALRRTMKADPPLQSVAAFAFREDVKQLELAAERLQLDHLCGWAARRTWKIVGDSSNALGHSLRALVRRLDATADGGFPSEWQVIAAACLGCRPLCDS